MYRFCWSVLYYTRSFAHQADAKEITVINPDLGFDRRNHTKIKRPCENFEIMRFLWRITGTWEHNIVTFSYLGFGPRNSQNVPLFKLWRENLFIRAPFSDLGFDHPPNSQNYPLFQTSTRKIKYICAPSSQKHKFWFRGESRYWRNSTDFANLQRKNVCRRTSGQANTDSWFKLKFGGFFQNSRFAKNNANNLRNENEQLEHTKYFGISKIFGFTKKITATKRQKITNVKIR